jgi:hypothetical protein
MKNSEAIYYNGILLTPEKIAMIQGKSEVASVFKKDIRAISLEEGRQTERPTLQIVFGIAILFIPFFSILYILGGLISGEPLRIPLLLALAFAPLGVWMIREGIRHGYYLLIELDNDRRKLAFEKNCEKTKLKEFTKSARQLGYGIDASILGLKKPKR